jgi:hypothetical protein
MQDSRIWVDLYPFLSGPALTATGEAIDRLAVQCLFSHFRLLQTCERAAHADSLESIDAVLGCPVGLFTVGPPFLAGFPSLPLARKNAVVSSVLYAVSW